MKNLLSCFWFLILTPNNLKTGYSPYSVKTSTEAHLHHFISVSEQIAMFSSHYLQRRWEIKTGDMCLCLECCTRTAGRCFSGSSPSESLWCDEKLVLFAMFNSWEKTSPHNLQSGILFTTEAHTSAWLLHRHRRHFLLQTLETCNDPSWNHLYFLVFWTP